MDIEGFGEQAEELTWLSRRGKWGEMLGVFTEEMAHRFAVIGTHDMSLARIRERFSLANALQFSIPVLTPADFDVLRELVQGLKKSLVVDQFQMVPRVGWRSAARANGGRSASERDVTRNPPRHWI